MVFDNCSLPLHIIPLKRIFEHEELEELTKIFMKLKKDANKIKNNGALRRRDIYAVGWRASNNEGYSLSYYTIEGSMQNTIHVVY